MPYLPVVCGESRLSSCGTDVVERNGTVVVIVQWGPVLGLDAILAGLSVLDESSLQQHPRPSSLDPRQLPSPFVEKLRNCCVVRLRAFQSCDRKRLGL